MRLNHTGIDIDHSRGDVRRILEKEKISHVIIATPTHTHYGWLTFLKDFDGIRILCEKPITKNLGELLEIIGWGLDLTMMYQYLHAKINATEKNPSSLTSYNFYNHGNDGLVWDCIQLIGLADGEISLREDSPTWETRINGRKVYPGSINNSYVEFLNDWIYGDSAEEQSQEDLLELHEKAYKLQEKVIYDGRHNSLHWHPGQDEQH